MSLDLSSVKKIRRVHFIGIGGIGVSALARMYLKLRAEVTGSDREADSPILAELRRLGAKITHGHKAYAVSKKADLIIYTIAISANNPELLRARALGIKALSYPEALGELSASRPTIAIAGTHGKTTTTAMVAEILLVARRDPMVIVGSLLRRARRGGSNFIAGNGPLVVEACEYRRSFLNLSPKILVITNIESDHLDYYRNLTAIKKAFRELADKVPAGGVITEKEYRQVKLPIKLRLPGEHNQRNAQAAIAAAKKLGLSERLSRRALAAFRGTWRRFEYRGRTLSGALLYDDYAHHPTEIRATLEAARERFLRRRLVVVFQPHLYSRTKLLFHDFTASLAAADEVLVLPIYAAREKRDPEITGRFLATALGQAGTPARYFGSFKTAEKYLNQRLGRGDLLLTMGAGDVYILTQALAVKK